jgi:hypothetical protein
MQQQSIIRSVLQKVGQRIDIETNYELEETKTCGKTLRIWVSITESKHLSLFLKMMREI